MTFKTTAVRIFAYMHPPTPCKGSSAVLMQQSSLRSFHPLWNASAHNEDGVCQFSPRHKTVTIAYGWYPVFC